jgi:hypothetical protein
MSFDEIFEVRRDLPVVGAQALAQLVGDLLGGVTRSAFGSIEGNDPHGVAELAIH